MGNQMKLSFILPLLAIACLGLYSQETMPRMTNVEPESGKVGDILTVSGDNLDKTQVAELYLTDGKKDTKVVMTEQTPTSIKFKIPVKARPGRFALMVLTTGKEPKLIEQPVKVTVE
jgi:hypothetical protein